MRGTMIFAGLIDGIDNDLERAAAGPKTAISFSLNRSA